MRVIPQKEYNEYPQWRKKQVDEDMKQLNKIRAKNDEKQRKAALKPITYKKILIDDTEFVCKTDYAPVELMSHKEMLDLEARYVTSDDRYQEYRYNKYNKTLPPPSFITIATP